MILYCGDSTPDGPARYLLGLIKNLHQKVFHVPPGKPIPKGALKKSITGIIFSDYSHRDLTREVEEGLDELVRLRQSGLLMVGGWGSFSGPFGHWQGSIIEKLLPVECLTGDDRFQFPGGAIIQLKHRTPFLNAKIFSKPPVICGLNRVRVKKGAVTLLSAKEIIYQKGRLSLKSPGHPLFIMSQHFKSAALTTDLAPHWCGGLVDWGKALRKIKISKNIDIQVGTHYIEFVSKILRWLISE